MIVRKQIFTWARRRCCAHNKVNWFSSTALQHDNTNETYFSPNAKHPQVKSHDTDEVELKFPKSEARVKAKRPMITDVHHCNRLNESYDKVFSMAMDEYRGDLALPPHLQSLCRLALKERIERDSFIPQGVLGVGKSAPSTARRVIYVIASFADSFMWVASTRGTAAQDFVELCLRANLYPKRDPFKWILQQGVDNLIAIPLESLNANAGEIHAPPYNNNADIDKHADNSERKNDDDSSLTAPPKVFIPPAARFGPLSKAREQYWRGILAGAAMPDLDFSY